MSDEQNHFGPFVSDGRASIERLIEQAKGRVVAPFVPPIRLITNPAMEENAWMLLSQDQIDQIAARLRTSFRYEAGTFIATVWEEE